MGTIQRMVLTYVVGCVLGKYKEISHLSKKNEKNENTKKYKNIYNMCTIQRMVLKYVY